MKFRLKRRRGDVFLKRCPKCEKRNGIFFVKETCECGEPLFLYKIKDVG